MTAQPIVGPRGARPPATRPCPSCPYRCDVPAGVWRPEEYEKLPAYDNDTQAQPLELFLCHQQNQRLCAGWCGTHDMSQSLAVRIAVINGQLDPRTTEEVMDYTTPLPLFASGAEAATHGLSGVARPTPKALKMIERLRHKALARR